MTNDLGTLVIVILKAKNLHDKHSFRKQDVFGQVQIEDNTKKTTVEIKGGQHPVWDEEVRVPITAKATEQTRTLYVSCWEQEPRGPELIGKGQVNISETLKTGEFDDWIPLEIEGVYKGEIYLEMTFFAAGPPPSLSRRPSKLTPKDRLARPSQHYDHVVTPGARSISKSPVFKDAVLPPLPEEPTPVPTAIPALLRAGRPPTSSQDHPSSTGFFHSPAPSPPQSPPHLASAPAPLRPGRPLSQGASHHEDPFAASRYTPYNSSPYPLSSSPPQSYADPVAPPSRSSYSQSDYAATPRYEPHGSIHVSPTPQPYIVPTLPREPQSSTEFAYTPPYVRSARESSQDEYVASGYPTARIPAYNNGTAPLFPLPAVPPQHPPSRPYPYNYPPPLRDPDLDVPQFQLGTHSRHQHSVSMSDEPQGYVAPTLGHPRGFIPPPRPAQPPVPPKQFTEYSAQVASNHAGYHTGPSSAPTPRQQKSQDQDNRDRSLAAALERDEEERKKYLAAQEERDMELARQLDLELNLEQ